MVKGEVRCGLGSGRFPPTILAGDGDAPVEIALCPCLTGNLASLCHRSSVLNVCGSKRLGLEGLDALTI